jgi:hypothetical protein
LALEFVASTFAVISTDKGAGSRFPGEDDLKATTTAKARAIARAKLKATATAGYDDRQTDLF